MEFTRTDAAAVPPWPRLRVDEWASTRETVHMWLQIVGKIRMAHAPLVNHWWNVPLYVTPRGLGTSSIPYGQGNFDMEFDFLADVLRIRSSDGREGSVVLESKPVAEFFEETMSALAGLGIATSIRAVPTEVEPAVPFTEDYGHRTYDRASVELFWRQLMQVDRVMQKFRAHFAGKVSPVHFFWGAMDMACTRFSGRPAPPHPGGIPNAPDWVMVESYSRELSSCGFWPGGGEEGAFYSYIYPETAGYAESPVRPAGAYYNSDYRQFLLPYEVARAAPDPDAAVLEFFQSTYEAAAEAGGWDRADLETDPGRLPPGAAGAGQGSASGQPG